MLHSEQVKKAFAIEQNWKFFNKDKGSLYKLGVGEGNIPISWYTWHAFTPHARGVVREGVKAEGVDWDRFVSEAADGDYTLDFMKQSFKKQPRELRAEMNDDNACDDVDSDDIMSDERTIMILIELLHKLKGDEYFQFKKINYATTRSDFTRNFIQIDFILGKLCRSYGIENVQQFSSGIKHVLLATQFPPISDKYGNDVMVKCARQIGGRLAGSIKAVIEEPKNRNKSLMYHAMATKADTESYHHLSLKMVIVTKKQFEADVTSHFCVQSPSQSISRPMSQSVPQNINVNSSVNTNNNDGINTLNAALNSNTSNVGAPNVNFRPTNVANILPIANNNNQATQPMPDLPHLSHFNDIPQFPIIPQIADVPPPLISSNNVMQNDPNHNDVAINSNSTGFVYKPDLGQMSGIKQFVYNCVELASQGKTGYDSASKAMGIPKSTYKNTLAFVHYIESHPTLHIDAESSRMTKSAFLSRNTSTNLTSIAQAHKQFCKGYTPDPTKIFN